MSRIKKYNQVLFSIIGTIVLALLLVAGVKTLIDLFDVRTYDNNALVVREELDSLKELNIRNQIISIEGIHLFDTASKTYLIPVYHKQLADPSSRDDKVFGLMDMNLSSGYEYYGYGNYNNLILHNFSNSETRVLLDKRMNIDRYNIFKSKRRTLIVFTGWDLDTNNDGKLGEQDFKQVYIYDHSTSEVNQIKNSDYRVLEYEYLKSVDELIFKVTEIKNDSVEQEDQAEFLVSYSFEENNLMPLVDLPTLNKLQEIIDN